MANPISEEDIAAIVRECMKDLKMEISDTAQKPVKVGKPKTLKPITGDYLRQMFRSRQFKELLSQAANRTIETSHETGFLAIRDLGSEVLLYSNVAEGGDLGEESAYSLDRELFKIAGYDLNSDNSEEMYNVFDLHFHPTFKSYVCPSFWAGDLTGFTLLRKQSKAYSKPLCAVAQVDDNGNGEMILLQETWDKPIVQQNEQGNKLFGRKIIENIEDTIYSYLTEHPSTDTLGLAQEFAETGHYKAARVRFKATKKTVKYNQEDLKELDIFSYQPKIK